MSLRNRLALSLLLLIVQGSALGCAGRPPASVAPTTPRAVEERASELAAMLGNEPPSTGRGVLVRLAFGAEADLDLYVTDPFLDTVYFARHETRSGGRIEADVRCDTEGPRIEEIRFDAPPPGRYRIGIDHPRRCDGRSDPAAYAVAVHTDGNVLTAQGSVVLERFDVVVLEFDVPAGSDR